jgi:ABC-type cobalt transport system substrate-binding protein
MSYYFKSQKIEPIVIEYTKLYATDKEEANKIFTSIYPDLMSVVNGVIFTHRYSSKESLSELQAVAMEAIYTSLHRYNPEFKASGKQENLLFSYISLIARRSIMYYLSRTQKHRTTSSLVLNNEGFELTEVTPDERNYNSEIENVLQSIKEQISPLFIHRRYKRLQGIFLLLLKHIEQYGGFDKRAFIRHCVRELENGNLSIVNRNNGKTISKSGLLSLIRRLFRLMKEKLE